MARNKFAEGRCTRGEQSTKILTRFVPPEERAVELLAGVARERIGKGPEKLAAIHRGFTEY